MSAKNYENWSTYDKSSEQRESEPFFETQCSVSSAVTCLMQAGSPTLAMSLIQAVGPGRFY